MLVRYLDPVQCLLLLLLFPPSCCCCFICLHQSLHVMLCRVHSLKAAAELGCAGLNTQKADDLTTGDVHRTLSALGDRKNELESSGQTLVSVAARIAGYTAHSSETVQQMS